MDAIKLTVWIGEDKKLIIDLPAEVPVGLVDVQVTTHAGIKAKSTRNKDNNREQLWSEMREHFRTLLRNAGMLSTAHHAPVGWIPLTEEERMKLGTLPPGSRPTDEYVNEDRGAY
ncbi:MAG: hypothetical protein DCC55_11840 [Chloroflexi bacterium]|nr:MAG: hypothetical protein DCC55_11840 [Chloroflexota bacterium]